MMGIEAVNQPRQEASIEGELADRPVAHLLHQVFRNRLTGRLSLRDDSGDESLIFLREGCAVHVERPNDLDRLDRVLLESGAVSRAVLTRAQSMVSANKRLGQALIELGAIDEARLNEAIRAQLRRKLVRLLFVRQGTFALYIEEHRFGQGDELAHIRVDPRGFLYQGVRTAYDDARLMAELRPLEKRAFRLVNLPPGFLEAMGLNGEDALFRMLGKQWLTLAELTDFGGKLADIRAAILILLYTDLLVTRDLETSSPPPPAPNNSNLRKTGVPRITPLPAGREDGAPVAQVPTNSVSSSHSGGVSRQSVATAAGAALEELHGRLDQATHFEVLGITESATPAEVQAAYMKAVKSYHPDRLSGLGLAVLAPKAERVMARVSQAVQVLSDTKQRMNYVRGLRGEKTDAESAGDILEAEAAFKDGEQCLKRNDLRRAMDLFTQAVKKSPKETEYRAYLAWTRYMETPTRKDVIARETLRMIAEALKERPNFVRGHFWTGKIHAALGSNDLAEAAFRKCMQLDAEFIDAQRELRLLEMRRRKPDGSAPDKDDKPKRRNTLLDKLLKRD